MCTHTVNTIKAQGIQEDILHKPSFQAPETD